MESRLEKIQQIIVVVSGKGGVGKSSVSAQIAMSLSLKGFKVGILDTDLCGPSIPKMMGVEDAKVLQASGGWVPVSVNENLCVMSIGFLLPSVESSVVWRGPKKNAMIRQFLSDVYWEDLDYLIIDTPPGTSDEHLCLVEYIGQHKKWGAVVVTTPQECTNLFSKGGGALLAAEFNTQLLSSLPIEPKLAEILEGNKNVISLYGLLETCAIMGKTVEKIIQWFDNK